MTLPRIIPLLSILNGKLVKTQQFRNPKYLGDPINAIKIFNEKWVDELILVDIGLSDKRKEPDFQCIKMMASECFIPLAYGGGIHNIFQAEKLFKCGVEKVILNSACYTSLNVVTEISREFGSQSVVVSVDYKKNLFGKRQAYAQSGQKHISIDIKGWISQIEEAGAGEIMIRDIGRDGMFTGYDMDFIELIAKSTGMPLIACGGARNMQDLMDVINLGGASAAAAGSCFVFKNNNRDSILINYIDRSYLDPATK
jgi:cyclase